MIQNKGSPHATPTSLLFDLHYAEVGVIPRWGIDRYKRLAAFLRLTHHELASLLCISHRKLNQFLKSNEFDGPSCLLLTILEHRVMSQFVPTIENPFPQIPQQTNDDARQAGT